MVPLLIAPDRPQFQVPEVHPIGGPFSRALEGRKGIGFTVGPMGPFVLLGGRIPDAGFAQEDLEGQVLRDEGFEFEEVITPQVRRLFTEGTTRPATPARA